MMRRRRAGRYVMCVVGAAAALLIMSHRTMAQPAPTFRAACDELRQAKADLPPQREPLTTISVEGALAYVHFDGALAYLGLCGPPHPRVMCITYSTGDRKIGDRIVVTGAFTARDPEYVLLDPCLPEPGQP